MSDKTTQILIGVLVACVVLLLYCKYSKQSDSGSLYDLSLEGMHGANAKVLPGLRFSGRDGFGQLPRHGTFGASIVEGAQDSSDRGLNDRDTVQTSASRSVDVPHGKPNLNWQAEVDVPLDGYTDGGEKNSTQMTASDETKLLTNAVARDRNRNKGESVRSVSSSRHLIDYGSHMQPTRPITA